MPGLIHSCVLITPLAYSDFQDEPTQRTPEDIEQEAAMWVQRCKTGVFMFVSIWIGWIVASQLLRGTLPSSWYMLNEDDPAVTGW